MEEVPAGELIGLDHFQLEEGEDQNVYIVYDTTRTHLVAWLVCNHSGSDEPTILVGYHTPVWSLTDADIDKHRHHPGWNPFPSGDIEE